MHCVSTGLLEQVCRPDVLREALRGTRALTSADLVLCVQDVSLQVALVVNRIKSFKRLGSIVTGEALLALEAFGNPNAK